MLGILFIYFIGKYFYQLAEEHQQNKWLFAILGVVTYYAGTFIGGIILGLIGMLFAIEIDWDNTIMTTVAGLFFGIITTYIFYVLLKRIWRNKEIISIDSIDDIGKQEEI